jgi:leucyl/phenylalanyl-tRNA--protein transferase
LLSASGRNERIKSLPGFQGRDFSFDRALTHPSASCRQHPRAGLKKRSGFMKKPDMPVFLLSDKLVFPPPHLATREGLLAVGGDLSLKRLLLAYRMGIFPWYAQEDPILWWSPDPRLILYPDELHVSRSLLKTLRKGKFRITMDAAFAQVMHACARSRNRDDQGTWIVPEMIAAYRRLWTAGYAHSVECWHENQLAGGLYGVSLGRCFFGESMFSEISDASKIALVHLAAFLKAHGFHFIDCQVKTDHLIRLGAREISRKEFLHQLQKALRKKSLRGRWYSAINDPGGKTADP